MTEPVRPGWSGWVGLVARLVLGGVLLAAGLLKVGDLTGSVQSVLAYKLFSYPVARFLGTVLPVVEIAVGLLLVAGLLTRASAAFEVPLVWAALVVLAVLGVIMYAITAYAERSMTGWAQRSQMAA